jgi:hypothetical protein
MKKDLLSEIHFLQSQIKTTSIKNSDVIKMKVDNESAEHLEVLESFRQNLQTYSKIPELTKDLEDVKKKIYEVTGGHRVLFEIGETIKEFNEKELLSELDVKNLEEKIAFWLNKLK